jgi:hypothetical protein
MTPWKSDSRTIFAAWWPLKGPADIYIYIYIYTINTCSIQSSSVPEGRPSWLYTVRVEAYRAFFSMAIRSMAHSIYQLFRILATTTIYCNACGCGGTSSFFRKRSYWGRLISYLSFDSLGLSASLSWESLIPRA